MVRLEVYYDVLLSADGVPKITVVNFKLFMKIYKTDTNCVFLENQLNSEDDVIS